MTTESAIKPPTAADYLHLEPLPEPPREPDMQQHEKLFAFDGILKPHFSGHDDVLISGEGYLLPSTGVGIAGNFAPDGCFARGVRDPDAIVERNGYVISEVGKPPDLVLEVASRSTGRRDYTIKRRRYAELGVTEYWRFDHTGGRFHDAPLAGDTLVNGRYEPLPIHYEPDGLIWGHSPVLGLDFCWDEGDLRFRDPATGKFLPTPEELKAERDDAVAERDDAVVWRDVAEAQRDYAQSERDAAEAQRDDAQAERDDAQARAQAAEAERDALREQLRRLQEE